MPTPALHDPFDPGTVVQDAVRAMTTRFGAELAFGGLRAPDGSVPLVHSAHVSHERFAALRPAAGRGLGGRVLDRGRPHVVADYGRARTITDDFSGPIRAEGLRGIGCVPIVDPTGVVGLLYAGSRRPGAPGDRVVDALARLADDAALALNARRIAALEDELRVRRGAAAAVDGPALTPRERDVLRLLAEGCSNREIADRLVVAEPTVKGHVGSLMRKLDAPSRLRVVARAARLGLLPGA